MAKGPDAFRTISEAADEVGVPQHVLRFWETRFSFIRPMKRAGGRRFYRPQDVALLQSLKARLHDDHLTIKDVQKLYKEEGLDRVLQAPEAVAQEPSPEPIIIAPAVGEPMKAPETSETPFAATQTLLSSESEMRLRLTLTGLLATKRRLDDILLGHSA